MCLIITKFLIRSGNSMSPRRNYAKSWRTRKRFPRIKAVLVLRYAPLLSHIDIPIILSIMDSTVNTEARYFHRPSFVSHIPTYYVLSETVKGCISFEEGGGIYGRPVDPAYWTLIGRLHPPIIPPPLNVDPVEYKFNIVSDMIGPFRGHIGRGELFIIYESGATITGKAAGLASFYPIEGETTVPSR